MGALSSKIGRLLDRFGVGTIFSASSLKIQQMLQSVKNDFGLRVPRIYRLPYGCGVCYIGQISRPILDLWKEHQKFIRLSQPEKLALAEHCTSTGHQVLFHETKVLSKIQDFRKDWFMNLWKFSWIMIQLIEVWIYNSAQLQMQLYRFV